MPRHHGECEYEYEVRECMSTSMSSTNLRSIDVVCQVMLSRLKGASSLRKGMLGTSGISSSRQCVIVRYTIINVTLWSRHKSSPWAEFSYPICADNHNGKGRSRWSRHPDDMRCNETTPDAIREGMRDSERSYRLLGDLADVNEWAGSLAPPQAMCARINLSWQDVV